MSKLSMVLMPLSSELKQARYMLVPVFMLTTLPVSWVYDKLDSLANK